MVNLKPSEKFQVPKHLSRTSQTWVKDVIETFDLESHHWHLLISAAELLDRAADARAEIGKLGLTFTDRFNQPREMPQVAIERNSKIAFTRILRELGLDLPADDVRPPTITGRRRG